MVKLSKRLFAIAQLVPLHTIVADIGTDHALLPCYLVENQIAEQIYACDINQGPLDHASATIKKYGYENQIQTILSAGLENVPQSIETLVIAGMGFETIKLIIEGNMNRFSHLSCVILQSNTDLPELRAWLKTQNLKIENEVLIHDGFYYHIFKLSFGKQDLTPIEIQYGYGLEHQELWLEELQRRYDHLATILKNMPKTNERYEIIENEYQILTTLLKK